MPAIALNLLIYWLKKTSQKNRKLSNMAAKFPPQNIIAKQCNNATNVAETYQILSIYWDIVLGQNHRKYEKINVAIEQF